MRLAAQVVYEKSYRRNINERWVMQAGWNVFVHNCENLGCPTAGFI